MTTLEADPLRTKAQNCFLESAAITNPGFNKEANEDAILDLCEYGIFCVADGTGGPIGGQKASEEIVDAIQQKFWDTKFEDVKSVLSTVKEALGRSKIRIKRIAGEIGIEEMGAAVAILHLNPIKNSAFIVHAGDCRVYRFRHSSLTKLTQDHSVAAEMGLSDGDDISHIVQEKLTKAVGLYDRINPETISIDFLPGDFYLLASSGLTRYLKDSDIVDSIEKYGRSDVFQAANDLVTKTKGMKATEDVSVILIKIEEEVQAAVAVVKKKANLVPILVSFALVLMLGIVATVALSKSKNKKEQSKTSEEAIISSGLQPNLAIDGRGNVPEKTQNASTAEDNENSLTTEEVAKSQIENINDFDLGKNVETKPQARTDYALASIEENSYSDSEKAESQIVEIEKLIPEEAIPQEQSQLNTRNATLADEIESPKKPISKKKPSLNQKTKDTIEIDLAMTDKNSKRILLPDEENSLKKRISKGEKGILPPISIKNLPLGESKIKVNLYNNGAIEVIKKTPFDPTSAHEHISGEATKKEGFPLVSEENEKSTQNRSHKKDSVELYGQKNHVKKPATPKIISEEVEPQSETGSIDNSTELSELANSESEKILKEFRAQVNHSGLWAAIVEVNERWPVLKPEAKNRVQKIIMKDLINLCLEFRKNNYTDGDRVWEVLKIAPQIKEPALSLQIAKLLTNFKNDFENEVNQRVDAAQLNCLWEKVNTILQDNPEISVELISTNLINYIEIWSNLSQGNADSGLDLKNYFERARNIYKNIEPLVERPSEQQGTSSFITEFEELLLPLEICQKLSETRLDIQTKLQMVIERISINFSIINVDELKSLMYSVYPDDQNSDWQFMKLKIVSDGRDNLLKMTNRLDSQKENQFPMQELSMFEKNAQELRTLLEEAQDHLLFVSILLGELEKQSENGDHSFFRDRELLVDFISQFKSVDTIFPTKTARTFSERFSQSLVSENY